MPNSPSAKKRLRQNVTRRSRNRIAKSKVRTLIRNVRKAVSEGEVEASEAAFQKAAQGLDKAAAKGVLHRNTAARTKRRLSNAVKTIKG